MAIYFDEEKKIFYLESGCMSYVMQISQFGFLTQLYYGKRIPREDVSYVEKLYDRGSEAVVFGAPSRRYSPNVITSEYPSYGKGDFRECAFIPRGADGARVFEGKVKGFEILQEKPTIPGMPSLYGGGETLVVTLEDEISKVQVDLYYSVYDELDAIARRAVIKNNADTPLVLDRAYSFSLDLPAGSYKVITQYGAHMRERTPEVTPLMHGIMSVDSKRGATSLHSSCFMALAAKDADEESGDVYGFNLIYSGSFRLTAEQSPYDMVRVLGGINDFDFSWKLLPGESFYTPEAAMVYSGKGLGAMSRTFHDLYRGYIINKRFVNAVRPIVINNWEATYFNFDIPKLCSIIDTVKDSGIDMFVLDDGWFGRRDSDRSSLGDWTVNKDKLKGDLSALIDYVHNAGMKFGLWFEPEMVSEDSDIYREHPDWAIKIPYRDAAPSRDQLVFDLTKPQVRDYVVKAVNSILSQYKIDYVKWDMNRNITEIYSDGLPADGQKEIMHRYILGVYEICERIINGHPDVFFEGCASGGGRFDAAMAYYFPQIWTSDDTDANERTRIQYGTSLCYPLSMMSCHVSICPNHGTARTTPFKTRGDIAHLGATGYELDTTQITPEELAQIRRQVTDYKAMQDLVLHGDLYRLDNPFTSNYFCEELVKKDKTECVVTCYRRLMEVNSAVKRVYLRGLDPDMKYRVEENGMVLSGAVLMNVGLIPEFGGGDFMTAVYHIKKAGN